MPKIVSYPKGSFLYFAGDQGDKNYRVYVLQSGSVDLISTDVQTNDETHTTVQRGEFIGVKSALGKLPHEESASVLQDSQLMAFSVAEFESFAIQNPNILIKMLRVFSRQLRTVNKQLSSILLQKEADSEQGLFNVGENLLKSNKIPQALYVFKRYLSLYPNKKNTMSVKRHVDTLERNNTAAKQDSK
jgi:CRP-like cAMP-binding protein